MQQNTQNRSCIVMKAGILAVVLVLSCTPKRKRKFDNVITEYNN